jgi:hypothetical protein
MHLPAIFKIAACSFSLLVISGAQTALGNASSEATDPLGRAWGKKISHFDGTYTNSTKDADKNQITEDTFDTSDVLAVRRLFFLDTDGNLRRGIILDGKGNPKASTLYDYRGKQLVEERMFNAQGQLIRRLFPPGVLPNVPQNQKRSIAVTIDPSTQKEVSRQATEEKPVEPITEAQKTFNPGIDMGGALRNDRANLPKAANSTPPQGRVPLLPQRRN